MKFSTLPDWFSLHLFIFGNNVGVPSKSGRYGGVSTIFGNKESTVGPKFPHSSGEMSRKQHLASELAKSPMKSVGNLHFMGRKNWSKGEREIDEIILGFEGENVKLSGEFEKEKDERFTFQIWRVLSQRVDRELSCDKHLIRSFHALYALVIRFLFFFQPISSLYGLNNGANNSSNHWPALTNCFCSVDSS